MGKKKATGLSKRQSFLDPAIIAENRDIMRFNQHLEEAARGIVRPERPERAGRTGIPARERRASTEAGRTMGGRRQAAGPRTDGRLAGGEGHPKGPRTGSSPQPRRTPGREGGPRPPRPPALGAEEEAALRAVVVEAAGETGLDVAGQRSVDELARSGRFDRATEAGWQVAVGGHPEARTPDEWALLRAAWQRVRLALLEAWAADHPAALPLLERERKEAARSTATPRPRRGHPRRRPARAAPPQPPAPAAESAGQASAAAVASLDAAAALVEPAVDAGAAPPARADTPAAPEAPEAPGAGLEADQTLVANSRAAGAPEGSAPQAHLAP